MVFVTNHFITFLLTSSRINTVYQNGNLWIKPYRTSNVRLIMSTDGSSSSQSSSASSASTQRSSSSSSPASQRRFSPTRGYDVEWSLRRVKSNPAIELLEAALADEIRPEDGLFTSALKVRIS